MDLEFDEPFEITVQGKSMLVIPVDDGTYDVYEGSVRIGNLFADIGIDTEPVWKSGDLVGQELVEEIGYAIEMKEM